MATLKKKMKVLKRLRPVSQTCPTLFSIILTLGHLQLKRLIPTLPGDNNSILCNEVYVISHPFTFFIVIIISEDLYIKTNKISMPISHSQVPTNDPH